MDIARAMYLGGKEISPSECNYLSYDKKGLLCCFCGEPVYLKKGNIRKPHFAHFPGTDPKQVEECELRASSYGNSSQLNSFIKDRGQRLKIFQQHFLNLIYFEGDKPTNNLDFNNWINSIKRDHSTVIDIIVNDCTSYFIRYCHQIAAKYIKQITNNNNQAVLIQQEIALEAISYLCVKSSCKLLEYLLYYGIYKLFKHELSNLFKNEVKTQNVDNICHLVVKIIMLNSWLNAITEITPSLKNEKSRINSQLQKTVTHNFRSGYLNSWSHIFSWAIDYHDKFSDLFNENDLSPNKIRLQVAIEGADQLNLYKVTDLIKYQEPYDVTVRNTSEVSRSKLCTLATLQVITFPQYIWKSSSYRYEKIADYLNKHIDATSQKLNDVFSTLFSGIVLTDDTCKIGNRVLCQRHYLGDRVMVRSVLNPVFMDGRNVKQECLWLEQVRQQVQKMIINKSAAIIADQLNDYDKLKEHNIDVDRANKSAKKLLSTIKSLLNKHGYQSDLINDYASLLLTYLVIDCKLSQFQIVGLLASKFKLIPDDQISLEDKVLGIDPNKLRKQALQELIDQLINNKVPDHSYQLEMKAKLNRSKREQKKQKYDNLKHRKKMFKDTLPLP